MSTSDHDADAQRAVAWLRRGAWIVSLAIALGMPGLRAYFGAQAIDELLEEELQLITLRLSERASTAPDLWLYHTDAVQRIFNDAIDMDRNISAARLVDGGGRTILTAGRWSDSSLQFDHHASVFDSGVAVATVFVQQTYDGLLASVARTAALSLPLALATWFLVARVAVGSIVRSLTQLQTARSEAERAGAARTVFLATMSHEIRTPMNGVIGMTSLLRETPLTDQQRHYIDVIRGSGETLLRVINDILEFSKVESGRTELEPQVFQPDALAEEVLVLLEPMSHHKKLKLVFEAGPGLPAWVTADASRLRQVLVNLVGNALKFSDRGTIRLRVECAAPDRLRYVVQDQGAGMTAEQLRVVFDPFVQADASISRRYGGSGLGLAISRRLVEMMGGSIQASSEPGRGTTMTVEVSAPAAPAPAGSDHSSGVEALVGKRVLIADDEPVNVEIVEAMVRGWGMHPVCFTHAQEALASLGQGGSDVDVALLDFNMPGLDGHALGRRMRELRPDLPLVLLSSKSGALDDGGLFNARLSKPVLRTLLRDTLRSVLTHTPTRQPDALSQSAIDGLRADLGAPSLASLRVLVAEDNPVNAIVVSAMLERLGVVCDLVGNGLEALEAIQRQRYDLVLMDIQMPEMNGLEAARRVRASALAHQPRIVAFTANIMSEDRVRCAEAGMDEFLSKPLQLHELEQILAAQALKAVPAPRAS